MKVRAFQSDMGGEFVVVRKFLQPLGIEFSHSCPPTQLQNGLVEIWKQHHIVEVSLSLLAQSTLRISSWWDVVLTAV